ncbi:MAG: glycosyltransferase family 39 protein [Bryobacterales bacterium]|nr:glycosyltransferase family 39 protein [Bryobacterales bacterium]
MPPSGLHNPRIARSEIAVLAVLLVLYLSFLIHLSRRTGVTLDEPSHILSSILYWEGKDRLLPRDLPPLIKIVGGWAAATAHFPIVEESHPVWNTRHEWMISLDMMRRMKEDRIRDAFFQARLPLLVFPVATALLLWWWARQLYSPIAALLASAIFMLEPTALGHAVLFKNDHAAAFGFLLFWFMAWRYWKSPSATAALTLGFATAIGLLAKLSMLILIPLAVLCIGARCCRTPRTLPMHLGAATAICYTLALAACQFEVRWWMGVLPLPEQIAHGVGSLIGNVRSDNAVYLLGQRHGAGHPAYFLTATLVKAPEAILLLFLAGLPFAPLLAAPAALYFTAASLSSLQFGFRLILPCLPLAILVCAAALHRWRSNQWLAPTLLATLLAPLILHHPFYISYFNTVSGGPKNALRYLSDSNVDWGQDIRQLRHWMHRHNVTRMGVSYLGGDNPLAYLRPDQMHWIEPPFNEKGRQTLHYQPAPGLYAISANLLTGQFFDAAHRDFYKAFRALTPIDYAGYSIYIFRVP